MNTAATGIPVKGHYCNIPEEATCVVIISFMIYEYYEDCKW
jgi:hypothetical protein